MLAACVDFEICGMVSQSDGHLTFIYTNNVITNAMRNVIGGFHW